jgi:hypothetical protein
MSVHMWIHGKKFGCYVVPREQIKMYFNVMVGFLGITWASPGHHLGITWDIRNIVSIRQLGTITLRCRIQLSVPSDRLFLIM